MNERIHELQAEFCRVFTHPTRIAVLELLEGGERTVTELAEASGVAQPTLSQHLSVLRSRGVVATRREGTAVHYRLTDERILEACHLVQDILSDQQDRLAARARATVGPSRRSKRRTTKKTKARR